MARSKKGKKGKKGKKAEELEEGWAKCPECDRKVKEANLRRHLQKVHGLSKTEAMKVTGEGPKGRKGGKAERGWTTPVIAICIVIIIIVAGVLIYNKKQSEGEPVFYIDRTTHDFGTIPPDTVVTTFAITNDGDGTLEISEVETTCDCTVARFTIDGKQSPNFQMNGNPEWTGKIGPGDEATLSVTYDPNMFNNRGSVIRKVEFRTNDVERSSVTLTLTAYVTD
jgi:hypothetical protein